MPEQPSNPLLETDGIADFAAIRPEHVRPAIEGTLRAQRAELARIQDRAAPDAGWLMELEGIHDRLHEVWSPVAHLNSVASTPSLRQAFNESLPLVTEFESELGQNEALFERFELLDSNAAGLNAAERRLVTLGLRDFRLAGVALAGDDKRRFRDAMLALAEKQASFEQNLMDATDAFEYHETDRGRLEGLPEIVLNAARQAAEKEGLDGYFFRLTPPTYQAIVTHADSEPLRAHFYKAWVTRASDQGDERWNNAGLIDEILGLRYQAARLLGFANYAELSLASKMAASADEVVKFLTDLAHRSKPVAQRELAELESLAGRRLNAWDVAYYAEKLRQQRFQLAEEELRPYFPLPRVLSGLFELAGRLFDLRIEPAAQDAVWHEDVRYYEIRRGDGGPVGGLFTDLFARPNKRGGAWMDVCVNRSRLHGALKLPVAHLVCNFSPPLADAPSLLTHNDVVTLFHEFGHSLHHLLTEIEYPSLSGLNGVAWDAVELPSQFLENYAWLPDVLSEISGHYLTGEALAAAKIETLNRSRSFLSGLSMLRQLEFGLFDFRLHLAGPPPQGPEILDMLAALRREIAVIEQPEYNRFANSFTHIFGGGYAAGYYSYKWAEVLAADAFAAFAHAGAFDRDTADRFRRSILAIGGSKDPLDAFIDFRGRPPELEALLTQSGIAA